jgi:hypothetical protein
MINLVPFGAVVRWVAVGYAALIACGLILVRLAGYNVTLVGAVKFALAGALPLQLIIGYVLFRGWRRLWRWFPSLGDALFPDLNGQWAMTVHWAHDGESGFRSAHAVVKQDLTRISIEVAAQDSDSQTLSVSPKRDPESGRPMLHYLYRVTPHAVGANPPPPYDGAAILRLEDDGAMSGNYWTSSPSTGRFTLVRV